MRFASTPSARQVGMVAAAAILTAGTVGIAAPASAATICRGVSTTILDAPATVRVGERATMRQRITVLPSPRLGELVDVGVLVPPPDGLAADEAARIVRAPVADGRIEFEVVVSGVVRLDAGPGPMVWFEPSVVTQQPPTSPIAWAICEQRRVPAHTSTVTGPVRPSASTALTGARVVAVSGQVGVGDPARVGGATILLAAPDRLCHQVTGGRAGERAELQAGWAGKPATSLLDLGPASAGGTWRGCQTVDADLARTVVTAPHRLAVSVTGDPARPAGSMRGNLAPGRAERSTLAGEIRSLGVVGSAVVTFTGETMCHSVATTSTGPGYRTANIVGSGGAALDRSYDPTRVLGRLAADGSSAGCARSAGAVSGVFTDPAAFTSTTPTEGAVRYEAVIWVGSDPPETKPRTTLRPVVPAWTSLP